MTAFAAPVPCVWQSGEPEGVSSASSELTEILMGVLGHLSSAVSAAGPIESALEDLLDIVATCSEDNWDGYGAMAITPEAVDEAFGFIDALPSAVSSPSIVPEPSGAIGLQWGDGRSKDFVASLSGRGKAIFSGLLGGGTKIHGVARLAGTIPEDILQILVRHFSTSSSKARAA